MLAYSFQSIRVYEIDQILLNQRRVYFQPQASLFCVTCWPALIYSVKILIAYQVLSLQCAVIQFSVRLWVTLCLPSHTLLQLLVHKSNSVTWSALTYWCSYPDPVSDWLWLSFFLSLFVRWPQTHVLTIIFTFTHLKISRGLKDHPQYVCASSL